MYTTTYNNIVIKVGVDSLLYIIHSINESINVAVLKVSGVCKLARVILRVESTHVRVNSRTQDTRVAMCS